MKARSSFALIGVLLSCSSGTSARAANVSDIENSIKAGQWNDAAESAFEVITKSPGVSQATGQARLNGAYALFQRGYSNSALFLLKKLSAADWKALPQGHDRLVEIVSLFQKKVPLTLLPGRLENLNPDEASPYLRDEIRFAKGREAFEKQNFAGASQYLAAVAQGSRFFAEARYLLGTIAVKQKDYKTAATEFSKIFEPTVFSQTAEFWRDMGTQMTTHWGTNLRIMFDSESLAQSSKVAELALLGLARSAYGVKDYGTALGHYSKFSPQSKYYPRATLERIWTLLELNHHEEAQKAAADLSVNEASFESIEARTVRALVLTDVGQTSEARQSLDLFFKAHDEAETAIHNFEASRIEKTLPEFLKSDLAQDIRLQTLLKYESALSEEIDSLHKEDQRLFPVFANLASDLEPLAAQAKASVSKLIEDHVRNRRSDLARLYVQAKLIKVETFLEDREKLREAFKGVTDADTKKQEEHDKKLVELLDAAVNQIDEIAPKIQPPNLRLEFRQSELLWELSGARGILSQTTKSKTDRDLADSIKRRALKVAEDIALHHREFQKHAEALFFTGYAQVDVGRLEEGFKTLESYVKAYPKHEHVPDAYRILADMKFDANDFRTAEGLYKMILEFPDSPIMGYALYKIGWCAYNLKEFARALLGLEKATLWAMNSTQASQIISLKREGKTDLIALYAEVGDHHKAIDYFSKFFRGDQQSWISGLAEELDRNGQYEKSTDLYRSLIAMDPASVDNIAYQANMISGAYHLHRWEMAIEAAKQLVDKHKEQLIDPRPKEHPAFKAEEIFRTAVMAQQFEVRKQANPSDEAWARVNTLDELYLAAFSRWPASEEPLYRHAQFLLERKRLPEAAAAFRDHWREFKTTLKEPLREESLRNLIHTLEELDAQQTQKSSVLSKEATELLDLTEQYEKEYSKSKYARAIRFLRSAILFKGEQLEEGIKISQRLFDDDATDDIAKRAFKNLRVAYYEKKDWEATYNWSSALATRTAAGMPLYTADLKTVREESLFFWAENSKEDLRSAELFKKIASDPNMQRLREKSLYNAFIRLERAGSKFEALDTADQLEKTAPSFESLTEIAPVRAALCQEAGDYTRAAPLLERFIRQPTSKAPVAVVQQARLNLALIDEGLGKWDEATKLYKEYLGGEAAKSEEAKRGLTRIENYTKPHARPQFAEWVALEKLKADFERQPIPSSGELADKIRKALEKLEGLTHRYLDASSSSKTPAYFAFEAYCTLPFFYERSSHSIAALAEKKDLKPEETLELRKELVKITSPLDAKVKDFADQCLSKASEAEHDGPTFEKVLARWGWQVDPALKKKTDSVLGYLEKHWPWIDAVTVKKTEGELIRLHFQGTGNDDSWFSLGRIRWDQKKIGLARLTFVDALAKAPKSGRLLNAITAIDSFMLKTTTALAPEFEKAAEQGSDAAWANVAYLHLKNARLAPALNALQHAFTNGAFDEDPQIRATVKELFQK